MFLCDRCSVFSVRDSLLNAALLRPHRAGWLLHGCLFVLCFGRPWSVARRPFRVFRNHSCSSCLAIVPDSWPGGDALPASLVAVVPVASRRRMSTFPSVGASGGLNPAIPPFLCSGAPSDSPSCHGCPSNPFSSSAPAMSAAARRGRDSHPAMSRVASLRTTLFVLMLIVHRIISCWGRVSCCDAAWAGRKQRLRRSLLTELACPAAAPPSDGAGPSFNYLAALCVCRCRQEVCR